MRTSFITIEREYGSGGTKIARLLAGRTGVPCYGPEILEQVSEKYKISVEKIQKYEENVTNSFLYSLFMLHRLESGSTDMLTEEGHIFVAEQAAIKEMAAQGPAIFLGHCASEALKGRAGVVKVFIRCSDPERKHERILEDYGIPENEMEGTRKRFDKKRANYYYANTLQKWDDLKIYDMVLDSGRLGIEGCVAALRGIMGR